jgi:hypothetical protein
MRILSLAVLGRRGGLVRLFKGRRRGLVYIGDGIRGLLLLGGRERLLEMRSGASKYDILILDFGFFSSSYLQ